MNEVLAALKKLLPGVKKNVLLKNHVTFQIGGPAEYFFVAKNLIMILKAIGAAKKLNIPIFFLGGGSNLLVSDRGVGGLVIKLSSDNHFIRKGNFITADSGAKLQDVVDFSISHSLQGLEWAGGLPGTFGGAIRGNAGAFGGEIKDSILKVVAIDHHKKVRVFLPKRCKFSYRSSIFKEKKWAIIRATVKLKPGNKKELRLIANSHIAYRNEKHPLEYPSAGSIFKNVDVKKIPLKFQKVFADKIKQDPFPIVPAAWFIIGSGLAGRTIGRAQISKKHSNYIVNLGEAKANDVLKLISIVQKKVKKKYGIDLEPEVQMMGFKY